MRSNSFSSVSELSASAEESMQIFIKDLSGEAFAVSVPSTSSVADLREVLAHRTSLPIRRLRLVHAGRHISSDPSVTLSSRGVSNNSTIHLAAPLRGGVAKRLRCNYKSCKDAAQRIVGDCGFCNGQFCGKHRLLEDHKCSGLEDCKKQCHERNADKLNSERTVAIRGI